jgi:hypothetical protein
MSDRLISPADEGPFRPSPADIRAARRLRMARLGQRIARSIDKLVRAEEQARLKLAVPVWTDRLRTR